MVKKVIIAVVFIFVFAGVLLLPTYFSLQTVDAQLAQQGKTIAELEFALQESKTTNNNIRKFIVKDNTGVDANRVEADKTLVTDLFTKCFTWSTSDEYIDARKTVMQDYNIDENSSFMTTFLPAASRKTDEYGNVSTMIGDKLFDYTIDGHYHNEGFNMKFDNLSSILVDIDKDTDMYSYIGTVAVSVIGSSKTNYEYDGNAKCVIEYTTTKDGNVLRLNAATLS